METSARQRRRAAPGDDRGAVITDDPAARIPPFEAIAIPLNRLWVD